MWEEDPDRIDVAMGDAPAEANRLDSLNFTQVSTAGKISKQFDPRVVTPLVHHEHPLWRRFRDALCSLGVIGEGLFDKHWHAPFKDLFDRIGVKEGGSRDDYALDVAEFGNASDDPVGSSRLRPAPALR
jgi:hypothetical protein